MSRMHLSLDMHYFIECSQHNIEVGNIHFLLCISENRGSQIVSDMLYLHRDYTEALEFTPTPVCCNYRVKMHQSQTLSLLNQSH